MPAEPDIRFEPVTPAHFPLLRGWLNSEHLRHWWGDPETEFGIIVDMVEGRDGGHPFLFFCDKRAVGYIQYWHIGAHQTMLWTKDNPWLLQLEPETVGVDIAIGNEDDLARGLGTAALKRFARMLRGMGHHAIIIDPDRENHRAIRAYEKAGFLPVPHLVGQTQGVVIMHHVPQSEPYPE